VLHEEKKDGKNSECEGVSVEFVVAAYRIFVV
jgi:hypothetical protein